MCNSIAPGKYLRGKWDIILITGKKNKAEWKTVSLWVLGRRLGGSTHAQAAHMYMQSTRKDIHKLVNSNFLVRFEWFIYVLSLLNFFYGNNLHLIYIIIRKNLQGKPITNKQVQFILKQKMSNSSIIPYYKISMLSSKVTSGNTGKNRVLWKKVK